MGEVERATDERFVNPFADGTEEGVRGCGEDGG